MNFDGVKFVNDNQKELCENIDKAIKDGKYDYIWDLEDERFKALIYDDKKRGIWIRIDACYGTYSIQAYVDNRKVPVKIPGEYTNCAHDAETAVKATEEAVEKRVRNRWKNKARREEREEKKKQKEWEYMQSLMRMK